MYLVCGEIERGLYTNSVERLPLEGLDDSRQGWTMIEFSEQEIKPRGMPIVASISDTQLVILGGNNRGYQRDVLLLDIFDQVQPAV